MAQLTDNLPEDVLLQHAASGRFARVRGGSVAPVAFFGTDRTPAAASPMPIPEGYVDRMLAAGWAVVDVATDIAFSAAPVAWPVEPQPEPQPPAEPEGE